MRKKSDFVSYSLFAGLLLILTSSVYGKILTSQPVLGEGIYFVSSKQINPIDEILVLGLLSFEGELLWQKETVTVRSDAEGVCLCPAPDNGILSATAFGTGYTDILITKWSSSGEVLNRDTMALECYDAPYQLTSFDEGFLLLWDSWSDERGLHLASIDSSGNIIDTIFAVETMHPAPAALSTTENSFILVASPVVTFDEPSLVNYAGLDSIIWSHDLPFEEEYYPCFVVDFFIEDSEKFNLLWDINGWSGEIDEYISTQHSKDGRVESSFESPFAEFTEAVFVELAQDNQVVLIEYFGETSSFQIVFTDIQGNELERIPVDYNLNPSAVNCLPDNSFLVYGITGNSPLNSELIRVSGNGEVLWSFSQED